MAFREVDDGLWRRITPFLPPEKPRTGRPRANLRNTFNGILYVLATGCAWSDVPEKYGAKSTVHRFHMELCRSGTYQRIFQMLLSERYDLNKLDLSICSIDTDSVPAKKGGI
jgi:putative transposase